MSNFRKIVCQYLEISSLISALIAHILNAIDTKVVYSLYIDKDARNIREDWQHVIVFDIYTMWFLLTLRTVYKITAINAQRFV